MRVKPPILLVIISALYFSSEMFLLIHQLKPANFLRIIFYGAVFYFVFSGNRFAAKIWGVMSFFAGVVQIFYAVHNYPNISLLLALYASFFFVSFGYIFCSTELKKFFDGYVVVK